ncbi:Uncharacterised protein [Legionella wadsworthii]|uniref:Uncharacterized protein n=1 Tax=Legionella wadsworthii TaxID=28088 RepID=A0A378LQA6_9GAMM|nr:hypothetical protein [Legionella wadsworthii]STY29145.1 Uncharacterised protein [Legionella wadsworthii]
MSFGKLRGFFQSKPLGISKLALIIERDVPFYRMDGRFPENGLPMRGNFDSVPIDALLKYISGNKPAIAYGGTVVLDDLLNGFLKNQPIENGKDGLIVGIAKRAIELSSLYESLLDHEIPFIPEEHPNEAIIESLPAERVIAYITDLQNFMNGEVVKNHFSEINPCLPPEVTLIELKDSDFVRALWENITLSTLYEQKHTLPLK